MYGTSAWFLLVLQSASSSGMILPNVLLVSVWVFVGCLCCMQMACPLLCRGNPQPASLPAEPIALLDDMDSGMPFTAAPAAQQQSAPASKLDGSGKKPKKDKHKKESKEKKHKKHKREKKSKAGLPPSLSLLMQTGRPALLLVLDTAARLTCPALPQILRSRVLHEYDAPLA